MSQLFCFVLHKVPGSGCLQFTARVGGSLCVRAAPPPNPVSLHSSPASNSPDLASAQVALTSMCLLTLATSLPHVCVLLLLLRQVCWGCSQWTTP